MVCVTDVDGKLYPLGGNQRLKAITTLKMKEIPDNWVILADEWTIEQRNEFLIKDNLSVGEWDWEDLKQNWDCDLLSEWGLDIPDFEIEPEVVEDENKYTQKVDTPVYEPKNEKPQISELYNADRYKELIEEIENSAAPEDVKTMLKVAASRHIVFNYENMADFYANSDKEIQTLMENSALVIIDFNRAIELGYVKLREEIAAQYGQDYGDEE